MKKTTGSLVLAVSAIAISFSVALPAVAGETVLYQPAPEWVELAEFKSAGSASPTPLRILDRQIRIEDGRLWEYQDTAIRLATPVEMTQAGTVTASWFPDKGDLIVHEIAIVRGDTVVDVLDQGSVFQVLRRETALEQRTLDGALTATLAVPGLQVGDTLRLRYSVTRQEQALRNEVQSLNLLMREPDLRAEFARVRASWDPEAPVRFQAGPDVELAPPRSADGFQWLELALPLEEAEDMPFDAPGRYRRPAMLQLGTFADWAEVSRVLAPDYQTEGLIAPGSELAAKVDRIEADHATTLDRAVAALQLVQDEIGYFANGLNGGNYIPQSPEETWSLRYGDCKAKTLMLLAMLHEMDIDAEGLLVSTVLGDAVPDLLPMPGAFDHIIVRAVIDGQEYFLDGTGAGADTETVANVSDFRNGLPLRAEGADLIPIRQTLPRISDQDLEVTIDQRAGLRLPALMEARFDFRGEHAAMLEAITGNLTDEQRNDMGNSMLYPTFGQLQILDTNVSEGEQPGSMRITVSALMTTPTRFEGKTASHEFALPIEKFSFNPDRTRKLWQDIPVDIGPPTRGNITYTILLPDDGEGFTLAGTTQIDSTIANRTLTRRATLEGAKVIVHESIDSAGGVVSGDDIRAGRREAARIANRKLELKAPAAFDDRWRFAGKGDRTALAAIEAAYAKRIEAEPDEALPYSNRAQFRKGTYDFEGALTDVDRAIELERSVELLELRSQILANLLRYDQVRDDLQEAYELDPGPERALSLANAMVWAGDPESAIELLEQTSGDEKMRFNVAQAMADAYAETGNAQAGLALIDEMVEAKPNDSIRLNALCWYRGTWNLDPADALPVCSRAVESSEYPAAVLDSRAMVYLRLGRLDEALADAQAALEISYGAAGTELLRGLILREKGDPQGNAIIRQALARAPYMKTEYGRYGFELPN